MAQAKLTVSSVQAQALGLLVHKKKPVYPLLYEPKSGVNLRETKGTETIEVRDGADLYNLKRFQEAGYFDVVEGTVLPHAAAFSSISLNGTTLTLTFSGPITSPQLTSTVAGAGTNDIILKVNNVAVAATFAAVSNSTTMTTTIDVTTEDISVQLTQTGATKIKDAKRSSVLPATNIFSVAPWFRDITVGGANNRTLSLNFSESMYTAGVSSTGLGQIANDLIILIDGTATAFTVDPILKAAAANHIDITMLATPLTSISVQITPAGAAKLLDTDDTAVGGVLTRTYAMSAVKTLLTFAVASQIGESTIDEGAHTVAFTVPSATNITTLAPVVTISPKATISPLSEAVTDFTAPVTYTVTAENGTLQTYTVTANVETASVSMALTTPAADADNTIVGGGAVRTVAVGVEYDTASVVITGTKLAGQTVVVGGTNVASVTAAGTDIAPTYTVDTDSIKATMGTRVFTLTVSEAGKADIVYTVTVTLAASNLKAFLTYNFADVGNDGLSGGDVGGVVDGVAYTVALEVPNGTNVTALIATFTISPDADITSGVGGLEQISGTTPHDFTTPYVYNIYAQDNTWRAWTVTVTIAA